MDDVYFSDIQTIGAQFRGRKLSPVELTKDLLARIKKLDAQHYAFEALAGSTATNAARTAERELRSGTDRGPLHGIPVVVKDICFTTDMPTASGFAMFNGWMADRDATVVARLRAAGAVIIGKTYTTEGAYMDYKQGRPLPVNPWRADLWPGVSSAGTGVAVAAGMGYFGIGSDTGGSIRVPSSCNGLTGLKPTRGLVSRAGVTAASLSLDHIGPMTRSVADIAAGLRFMAGPDDEDIVTRPVAPPDYMATLKDGIRGVRIGLDTRFVSDGTETFSQKVISDALDVFRSLGAEVREVTMPSMKDVLETSSKWQNVEAVKVHEQWYPEHAAGYGPAWRKAIEAGLAAKAVDVIDYFPAKARLEGSLERLFTQVDLLIMPTLAMDTPTLAQWAEQLKHLTVLSSRFLKPFNISGHPSLTLPGGFKDESIPVGFQLLGRHFDEELLLRAGYAFQYTTSWHLKRPTLAHI